MDAAVFYAKSDPMDVLSLLIMGVETGGVLMVWLGTWVVLE
jgi:fructose-specific phosphotransferase system IIC component